jgi:hypothetical protein
VSYAAVDSEVLFWFVVALTALLVALIGVVITTPPGAAGAPQPPELSAPAGYRPRHAEGVRPELTGAGRGQMPGRPPWGPAPRPPGLAVRDTAPWSASCPADMTGLAPGRPRSAQMATACPRPGGRGGAHRQAPRHGTHRVRVSTGQLHGPAGRTGRHRVEAH